jgi:hypothetical protein
LNYVGKFDAALSLDGEGFHSHAKSHLDSFSVTGHGHVPQGAFVVPDPNLLFHGEFKRAGIDLVLSHDGHEFVVHDYFKGEKRAAIASPDGAHLSGDIVNALAGHVQYAQAASGAAAAQVIGHVTKLSGSATAVRNGVSIILNNGDNVEKGDVLSTGSDSTLGVTFIDGTVFGLSSNARMVLNEMVYDPNGSSNSSLLSLVAGTITFVAGETAKHGDMKIDTPVATMGIRGTAVLTEISFSIPAGGGDPQPQANFQVLVEPDGTTGSYILFDKVTLLPIATVNQAGQMIQISGGNVSVTNALLSPDVQKLITDVFSLKFTDNNTNTKLTNNSTDTITQDANNILIKTTSGAIAQPTFVTLNSGNNGPESPADKPTSKDHIPGAPDARSLDLNGNVKMAFALTEADNQTGATAPDSVGGKVTFFDFNLGDRPTVKVDFTSFTYQNAHHDDVTAGLSDLQKADIAAAEAKISVVPASDNSNTGSATWTYSVPDDAFDFLAAGETLTLTYRVRVDNNFAANNETAFIDITITVTGTNDTPVVTSSVPTITFEGGTSVPGGPLTSSVPTSGTLTFTDVDLTDKHTVSVKLTSASLPGGTVPPGPLAVFEKAMSVAIGTDSTGTGNGVIDWSLEGLPVYLADFIPKGEVLTLIYTVTVTDSQGATSTQTITVTIKGTDSPAVVWIATSQAGSPPGGFWKDAANWETGTVPTINDDVIVITDQLHGLTPSYPVTIDAAAFAKSLTMNDFGGPPPKVINKSTLTIAQTLNLSADSILINSAGATISVGGKAEILGTSVLTNSGYLTLAAGGDFASGTSITNAGTIELSGGTLKTLAEIHNAGGAFKVDAGATLVVDNATIDSGTLTIAGTLALDGTSVLRDGALNNSGAVTVKGTVEFANETVNNDKTIEIQAGGALTLDRGTKIDNASGVITVDDGGKLVLGGAEITGGTINNYSGAPGGTIDVTGNSKIDGSATLNKGAVKVEKGVTLTLDDVTVSGSSIADHGTIKVSSGKKSTLSNATVTGGALNVSGMLDSSGTTTITNTAITNNSIVEAIGGVLALVATTSATITNAGTLQANSGELDVNGEPVANTGTLAAINDGTLKLNSTTVTNTGDGAVSVEAGSTLDLVGAIIDGGTLTLSGTLVSTGISAINDADITNTGTINVTSGTLTIDPVVQHTITNQNLIEANGGELDISGDLVINTGTLEAVNGGALKLTTVTVTNTGGTVTVDGTSKLYLSNVSINGGSLGNAGHLYGVAGSNSVTAAVTNTGTIEVQAGTLDLAGGLSGVGSLIIDSGATLELAGATAQTITFAGGTDTLQLDNVAGQSFGGTIAGQSSTGGTFNVTGAGNITTASGDALDFNASGGTVDAPADIVLTPTGALTGAANGVVVTQNGVGDISLTATNDITGLNGNGIVLRDSATGAGDITVTNLTGKATGAGAGSVGLLVEILNTVNDGDITIKQLGDATGGAFGIDATTHGDGDINIEAAGTITGGTVYGIRARSYGAGSETVTTDAGTVINSGSSGIVAVNRATSIDASDDSSITVNAYGTIYSGSNLNQSGNPPAGIQAGYTGDTTGSVANTDVNGSVTINNYANITAVAGYGIHAYNYGNGDVTVNDKAGTTVVGADGGIRAQALSGGIGDVEVTVGANAHVTGTSSYAILAYSVDAGDIDVSLSSRDVLASGSSGIVAVNYATAIASGMDSTISVTAHGTIHSGTSLNNDETTPGAIIAGYKPGGTSAFSSAVNGDVIVESDATITADAGFGIEAFTWGIGNVTVTTGEDSSITAAGTAIGAFDHGGGDVSVTNDGSATGAVGLSALATGAGDIAIVNDGDLTGTSLTGISVTQNSAGATGSTHITNTGSITGASGHAAIFVQENTTGTALIDNSGTIGPDDAGTVIATTYAVVETGGHITINNTGEINGNISVASATFNNEAGGTWTVSGTSFFGALSTIGNAGEIDLLNGASISGADGVTFAITNSGAIESWGTTSITGAITNIGTIEVDSGTMTLFGSLSGSGSVAIDANATLEVNATVSQTVTFSGDGAGLKIDTASFGGSISGLAATDKLDLSSIEYGLGTSATYVSNADHTGGVLTVTDADGHSISLTLVGDYSKAHFAGSDDGTGHTLITLNAKDDAPSFNAAETSQSTSFSELANNTGSPTSDPVPAATGTIHFTDIDLTDQPTATITTQTVTWIGADHSTNLSGTLTLDQTVALDDALTLQQTGNHNNGAIGWTYSIADSALDFLGKGQTATVVSTITLDDHHGGIDTAQVTVTIAGSNDAPTLDATTLVSVSSGDTDPSGSTVSALFADKFHDVDDGASLKAIAVTTDHATEGQGVWQYEVAGSDQWNTIGGVSDTSALVLNSDTLIRFVPADGFSGTPGTLDVHALDDTYTGAVTTASPASIDITSAGIGHGGSTPVSDKAASISTEVQDTAVGPVVDTASFTLFHDGESNRDTITGLEVVDKDSGASTDTFAVTARTAHPDNTSVSPPTASGLLSTINAAFADGITYDPGDTPPDTDEITLTVSDSSGHSDTVHFIFDEAASGEGLTLYGTSGKDVIFATDNNDTLIGNGGKDQFVFAPTSSQDTVQHTINDFVTGLDKIDLRQFDKITSWTDVAIAQQGDDTVLTLDDHDKILLKNVTATNLHASDFIVHVT